MDTHQKAAVVLAALELVPGDPSDLTRVLRDEGARTSLLGLENMDRANSLETAQSSPLAVYLTENLDQGRVEHWAKILNQGTWYEPLLASTTAYPQPLARLTDVPPVLFRSINPDIDTAVLNGANLAIVGSRSTGAAVLDSTRSVAAAAAAAGAHVVSGMASGVDSAAHLGALDAGGLTTAVLGTGIEHIFPAENTNLAGRIAQRGMLLSQFAPTAPRTGTTFLRRNAVIAALSQTSLIMDAREHSGSHDELKHALRFGRQVLLWKPALYDAEWTAPLIRFGSATFVESADEVLNFLG